MHVYMNLKYEVINSAFSQWATRNMCSKEDSCKHQSTISSYTPPCILVAWPCVGGNPFRLRRSTYCSTMKMEAINFSEISLNFYRTIRRHVPRDSNVIFITSPVRTSDLTNLNWLIQWRLGLRYEMAWKIESLLCNISAPVYVDCSHTMTFKSSGPNATEFAANVTANVPCTQSNCDMWLPGFGKFVEIMLGIFHFMRYI
jgi:hypothetical protein